MKKIVTAINNPKLNEELKKEYNFEVVGKDIQYGEAILEILEKNRNIDLIIISEEVLDEMKIEKLIDRIQLINEKIKIVFILEKENQELEKILIKKKILDIYYNNKINLKELIKIINKKEINMEEEIVKLKKIIEEKKFMSEKEQKNFIHRKLKNVKRKKNEIINKVRVLKERNKKQKKKRNMSTKIISFSGNYKSGKTTLSLIISQWLAEKNYKVLLIDGDLEKKDLSFILRKNRNNFYKKRNQYNLKKDFLKKNNKKEINSQNKFICNLKKERNQYNKKKYKKIKLKKDREENYKRLIYKKGVINFYYINKILKINTVWIDNNLYFFYGLNYLLKKRIMNSKKEIKILFKYLKKDYDFIIFDLSKYNSDKVNREIIKNCHKNFIVLEPDLLSIREIKELIKKYTQEWNINKNSLQIVMNKKSIISINKRVFSKSIYFKNKVFQIRENKFYHILLNNQYKRKILIKNKSIKYELNKMIKSIIFK